MGTLKLALLAAAMVVGLHPGFAADVAQKNDMDGAVVRSALAKQDFYGAGVAFNALVETRLPPKQTDRPDPLLDRLLVELMLARSIQPPRPILQRLTSETTSPDYIRNLLMLATAEEANGEDQRAFDHYNGIANAPGAMADQRFSAQLGIIRLKLATDAVAAVALLHAIDTANVPAARRWEVDLQLARALSIAEPTNLGGLEAQLVKAWAEAPRADIADHAIVRVANDLALSAARAGDRAKLIALLAVDRANRAQNDGHNLLASNLPVCGENGILRNDMVVIEVQRSAPPSQPGIGLVWANRPGIGHIFVKAAQRSGGLTVSDGSVAQFALRCRSAPADNYAISIKLDDIIASWMTAKGAYPLVNNDGGQNVTQLATLLTSRTARYGTTSIMRLPILLQLTTNIFLQAEADEQARGRINDLIAQITAILNANDAPEDLKLLWRANLIATSVATRTKTPTEAQAEIRTLLVAAAAKPGISRDFLYSVIIKMTDQPIVSSEFREAVLTAMLNLFGQEARNDPRVRALASRLYALNAANGDMGTAQAISARYELPADLCTVSNSPPRFISSNIRSEDYPGDLLSAGIVGANLAEFDLDTTGKATNGRLLISDPPYIFDDVTRQGITTIHYDPPRRDGKPHACRGILQNVRWQLPY